MRTSVKFNVLIVTAVLCVFRGLSFAADPLPRGEDVIITPANGEGLRTHNLFQSNMVLQREKPIAIWGWAKPDEKVTVTFAGNEQAAIAAKDRTWKVTLPALAASADPRTMTIKGADATLTFENILIGDVWVLAGQSNMEHPISRIEDGKLEIVSANFPQIRIMTVPHQNGPEACRAFPRQYQWNSWFKQHNRQGFWDVCTPETIRDFSGIGYVFVRRLHLAAQVPIGVLDASVGGTTLETWTPDAVLRQIADPLLKQKIAEWDEKVGAWTPEKSLADRIKFYNDRTERLRKEGKDVSDRTNPPTEPGANPAHDQARPGNRYAGMIEPLKGLAVTGAIWHQGYNNCFDGTPGTVTYQKVFPKMIAAWRDAFDNPEMAFGILSLCTQGKKQERHDFTSHMADAGPFIREAQYQTFLNLYEAGDKNIGFVSTYDLDRRWYHPGLKIPAGERAAKWALATQYGMAGGIKWQPPMVNGMTVEDGRILLKMNVSVRTVDNGLPIQGFAIAAENRAFHPADATFLVTGKDGRGRDQYDRSTIILTSAMVPKPAHFRYAWARMPMGNVQYNLTPMATQRSDNWPMERTPYLDFELDSLGKANRAQMNQIRQALKDIDTRRNIAEAAAVLKGNEEDVED